MNTRTYYLRRSARISKLDHVTNKDSRKNEGKGKYLGKNIFRYSEHVLRKGDKRWPKTSRLWKPDGIRKQSRPKTTWKQNMVTEVQLRRLRFEYAEDRQLWSFGTGKCRDLYNPEDRLLVLLNSNQ